MEKSDYVLVIVNPDGQRQIKDTYGERVVSIAIDAPADVRIKRYLDRDTVTEVKAEECCRRFLADNKDFKGVETEYTVTNVGNIKDVYKTLEGIIRQEIAKDIMTRTGEEFRNNPRSFLCK